MALPTVKSLFTSGTCFTVGKAGQFFSAQIPLIQGEVVFGMHDPAEAPLMHRLHQSALWILAFRTEQQ
jgi:hypothetical protein